MKAKWIVVVIAGCALAGKADAFPRLNYELAGGLSFPTAPRDFRRYWATGPNVSAGVSLASSTRLSWLFLFEWSSHETKPANGTWAKESRAVLYSGSINARLGIGRANARITPYVLGGVGLCENPKGKVAMFDHDQYGHHTEHIRGYALPGGAQTDIGVQVGLGIEVPAGPVLCIFLDARYRVGLTRINNIGTGASVATCPIRFGVRTR